MSAPAANIMPKIAGTKVKVVEKSGCLSTRAITGAQRARPTRMVERSPILRARRSRKSARARMTKVRAISAGWKLKPNRWIQERWPREILPRIKVAATMRIAKA